MPPKLLLDEVNKTIKIEGINIDTVTNINIEINDFNHESMVTMKFAADVTIIPPIRDDNDKIIYWQKWLML